MKENKEVEQLLAKIDFFELTISELRKSVRKTLTQNAKWQPEFHQNEVAALEAIYVATKDQLDNTNEALNIALEFVNKFEGDQMVGLDCFDTLNKIKSLLGVEADLTGVKA